MLVVATRLSPRGLSGLRAGLRLSGTVVAQLGGLPGFLGGTYAMYVGGNFLAQQISESAPEGFNWTVLPPLAGTAGPVQAANPQTLSVAAESKNVEASAKFIDYFMSADNLASVAEHPHYGFVNGDIRDIGLLDRIMPGVDAIVHLAAESHVDRSVRDASAIQSRNNRNGSAASGMPGAGAGCPGWGVSGMGVSWWMT